MFRELEIILPVSGASVFLREVGYAKLDRWVQVGGLRRTLGCWESEKASEHLIQHRVFEVFVFEGFDESQGAEIVIDRGLIDRCRIFLV